MSEWISIREKVPIPLSGVLCWDDMDMRIKQALVYENEVGDVFFDVSPQEEPPEFINAVHWMPLPEPPK